MYFKNTEIVDFFWLKNLWGSVTLTEKISATEIIYYKSLNMCADWNT